MGDLLSGDGFLVVVFIVIAFVVIVIGSSGGSNNSKKLDEVEADYHKKGNK